MPKADVTTSYEESTQEMKKKLMTALTASPWKPTHKVGRADLS
jgi:hypothetical protein